MIDLTIQDNGLAVISLNRPKVNALSTKTIEYLAKVILEVDSSSDIKLLILNSKQKHFCAGADLIERKQMNDTQVLNTVDAINTCFNHFANLKIPTVASINGSALGGGLELALCADFRIASETASLGLPETSLGIIPGAGGTQRLTRLIGISKAKYWIYSARTFTAEEAFIDGTIDFIASENELFEATMDLAYEIINNAPISLRLAKQAIEEGVHKQIKNALEVEKKLYQKTIPTNDRKEALKAFAEKRNPKWSNN